MTDTSTQPSWRDNPALVCCYDNFRLELQAIKNNQPFLPAVFMNNIAYRRKQLGLTQEELSKLAHVGTTSMSMAERNKAGYGVTSLIEDTLTRLEAGRVLPGMAAE